MRQYQCLCFPIRTPLTEKSEKTNVSSNVLSSFNRDNRSRIIIDVVFVLYSVLPIYRVLPKRVIIYNMYPRYQATTSTGHSAIEFLLININSI